MGFNNLIKNMKYKYIYITIVVIVVIIATLFFTDNKDKNLHVPEKGMIIFDYNSGYLFTNESGHLFWYNKDKNRVYQLSDPVGSGPETY